MRSLIHAALIAGLIAAPAAAVRRTPEEQLARLVQGLVPGKPVDCISTFPNNESQKIPGLAMAYRNGTTWYVNRFHGDCTQLSDYTIVVTRSSMSQLCAGDIVELRTQSPSMPAGSCIFDTFTPYTKPKG